MMGVSFDRDAYYESARAVGVFSAYHGGKEELFCRRLAEFLKGKSPILELGGGTGFHAALVSRMTGGRYVHTDKSAAMCDAARLRGIESLQMDGLAIDGIEPQAILAVGISTMVSEDVELRRRQFLEMARVLPTGGVLVITTPAYRRLSGEIIAWTRATETRWSVWASPSWPGSDVRSYPLGCGDGCRDNCAGCSKLRLPLSASVVCWR